MRVYVQLSVPLMLLAILLLAGCGSRGHQELLESRLRLQEEQLARLEQEVHTHRQELEYARKENETLQEKLSGSDASVSYVSAQIRVEKVVIDPLYTGFNTTGQTRQLVVFFAPQDGLGKAVKLPGDVTIQLWRGDQAVSEDPLEQWYLTAQTSLKYWQNGFLKSGFLFQVTPESDLTGVDQVRLNVVFASDKTRVLQAEQVVMLNGMLEAFPGGLSAGVDEMASAGEAGVELAGVVDAASKAMPGLEASATTPTQTVQQVSFKTSESEADVGQFPEWAREEPGLLPVEEAPVLVPHPQSMGKSAAQPRSVITSDNWTEKTTPVWR